MKYFLPKLRINSKKYRYLIFSIFIYTFLGFIPDVLNNLSEFFFNYSFPFDNEEVQGLSIIEIFITTVIIAPILETLIFQALFFQGFLTFKFFSKNKWLIVIISAGVFAFFHSYSLHYVFFAFYGGIVLGIAYLKTLEESNYKTAIVVVYFIHLLRNLIIFILIDIFKLL